MYNGGYFISQIHKLTGRKINELLKEANVTEFNGSQGSVNDRIMVIGHPEGNRYRINYGYIKSHLKNVRGNKVIEHNAYMKQGNSGGVALTENMKIAGINIAGSFTLLGHYRVGYMIPYDIAQDNLKNWRNNNIDNENDEKSLLNSAVNIYTDSGDFDMENLSYAYSSEINYKIESDKYKDLWGAELNTIDH